MMSDERARWRAAGIAVLGLAVLALVVGWNPANLPEPLIQRWIATKLPAGSSIVAVRQAIEEEKWKTVRDEVLDDALFVFVDIGKSSFSREYVYVGFWFDRFGRLQFVRVTKSATPLSGAYSPID